MTRSEVKKYFYKSIYCRFIDKKEYPYTKYPPYCLGPFYLMNYNVMLQLIELFEQEYHRNYIWMEDVFLTGIFSNRRSSPKNSEIFN